VELRLGSVLDNLDGYGKLVHNLDYVFSFPQ
jgi:hypothetical protein